MRTLALLAAFLLLAIQAQALGKHRMGQQHQDKYHAETKSREQAGTQDQDMVITLKGETQHIKGGAGSSAGYQRKKMCTCRQGQLCRVHESHQGSCKLYDTRSSLCCH